MIIEKNFTHCYILRSILFYVRVAIVVVLLIICLSFLVFLTAFKNHFYSKYFIILSINSTLMILMPFPRSPFVRNIEGHVLIHHI